MAKKYIMLTDGKPKWADEGARCYRIQAVRSFGNVKKGDIGGWIESEENLSHTGRAWVADNAIAYKDGRIYGNAVIYGKAHIGGYAEVFDSALVKDVWIYGGTKLGGFIHIDGGQISDFGKKYATMRMGEWANHYNVRQTKKN